MTLHSGIVAGVVLYAYSPISADVLLVGSAIAFAGLLIVYFRYRFSDFSRWMFVGITWFCSLWLGICSSFWHHPLSDDQHYVHRLTPNAYYSLVGEVSGRVSETAFGTTYRLKLHTADTRQVAGELLCYFPKNSFQEITLSYGDRVCVAAYVEPLAPPKNPHQFDYSRYMQRQGIYWRAKVQDIEPLAAIHSFSVFRLADKTRVYLSSLVSSLPMPSTHTALVKALLLGMRSELDESVYQDYIDSGAVHILAISGLHVGVVTMLLLFVLRFLPQRGCSKWIRLVIMLGSLWGFAFIAGLSPSVLRAVTMFTFIGIALAFRRRQGRYDALMMSMLLLLLVSPNLLFEVGFQMSYAAVFSILFFYPYFERLWTPSYRVLRYVKSLFWLGVSAQLGVLPVSLYYFHQFPILFFVSNLLIVPMLFPLLLLSIVVVFWAGMHRPPQLLITALEFLINWLNGSARWIASQEKLIVRNIYFDEYLLVVFLLFLLVVMWWITRRNYLRTMVLLASVLLVQSVLFYTRYRRAVRSEITIFHLYGNTQIGKLEGSQWQLYTSGIPDKYLTDSYSKAVGIRQMDIDTVPSVLAYGKHIILIIDSLSVMPYGITEADAILLRQSPKINLERLLSNISVNMIVADGSNYPSYIRRWKTTCEQRGITFHTTDDGSFTLSDE